MNSYHLMIVLVAAIFIIGAVLIEVSKVLPQITTCIAFCG